MKRPQKQEPPSQKETDEFSGEEIRDESPKFLGMDYFRVIYLASSILVVLMLVVYFTVEDEKV